MSARTTATEAIVLKRVNTGEMDRILTLLTPLQGKVSCIAKGVRKMSSSQRAFLEPGNHIQVLLVNTQGLPILTQTRLLHDFPATKQTLLGMKRLSGVLEIIDRLFPEGVEEDQLFHTVVSILHHLDKSHVSLPQVQQELGGMLQELGYQSLEETPYDSITEYVAVLADRPLNAYDFLTLKKV